MDIPFLILSISASLLEFNWESGDEDTQESKELLRTGMTQFNELRRRRN